MSQLRFTSYVLLATCLAIFSPLLQATDQGAGPKLRHGYVDMRYGQLHYSIAQPAGEVALPPIVLFHQSPNSSVEFDALVTELGKYRVAIAVDTPGYGSSDGPAKQPALEDYVVAIAEGLKNLGYGPGRPIDVFGFHTGAKIATELAILEPKMIRRMALSGIYVVPEEVRQKALRNLVHPSSTTDLFERFCAMWPKVVPAYRERGVPDEPTGRIRIDSLRPMTRQEYGHEAAFNYEPKFVARMALVTQPVLLVPLDDGLAQPTRDAKDWFAHATLIDQTFRNGAFFTQTAEVAKVLVEFSRAPAVM